MKKLKLVFLVICLTVISVNAQQNNEFSPLVDGDKVLFIGNSFTEWSGPLPSVIQALIKASGSGLNVSFTAKVKGMGILKEYATWESLGMIAEIQKGGWKYVVIQGWRDAIDTKDSQTSEGGVINSDYTGWPQCQDTMLKYFKILDAEVKKIGGTTILYEPHVSSNNWLTEFDRSAQTYAKIKDSVSCFHAPVVNAWDSMRVRYPVNTYACPGSATPGSFIDKLYADCGHQNANGMVLDAMTFYTIFTRRSAVTLKPVISMSKPELYEELAEIAYNTGKSILSMNNSGFTDDIAPSVPAGLQSTHLMPDSYNLIWTPSSDSFGVLGYNIYKNNTLIGISATPKFAVGGLLPGNTYAMKVNAFDSENNISEYSEILNVTTPTASSVDTSGILMDWDFTSQGGNASVATNIVMNGISSTTPSSVADVGPVFIAGTFSDNNGIYMRNQNKTLLSEAITSNQYISFSIAPQTGNEITIDSIKVTVFSQNQPRNFTLMSSVNGFIDGNEITTLTAQSESKQLMVTGHNNVFEAIEFRIYVWGPNNVWESFGLNDLIIYGAVKTPALPSFPTMLVASNLSETGFTLGWKQANDAVSYIVFMDGDSIGTTSSLNMEINGLTINSTYSMVVAAVTAAGTRSEESITLDVTIPDLHAPSIPENLFVNGLTNNTFILNWDASTDNAGVTLYEIFMNGNPYGNTAATFLPVPLLAENTSYSMSVRSKDAAGNTSALSDPINVTTLSTIGLDDGLVTRRLLYPNPAATFFIIDINSTEKFDVTIFDIQGRTVKSVKTISNGQSIDISDLKNGIYNVKIIFKTHYLSQKLIIR